MDTLQKAFMQQIEDDLSFPVVGTKIIKKKFEEAGVTLNKQQLESIEKKLIQVKDDTLHFDFDLEDTQLDALGDKKDVQLEIDLSNSDREVNEYYTNYYEKLNELVPEIVGESANLLLEELKKDAPAMLGNKRKENRAFQTRLYKEWKEPLGLLEMFWVIAFETGANFNQGFRQDAYQEQDFVFDVLTRLHARACQIASEVLTLLKAGYADGAHARWRSLHEIAVVGAFVKAHGSDTAEKYLLHNQIESYKVVNLHRQYAEVIGDEPISQEEYDSIEENRGRLITRFGSSYKTPYGWAASAVGKERPNFRDLEENAGLDYLRPFYKLASHNVHANPKGILFRLGLIYPTTKETLLAGPSNFGLTDPAHGTAISLAQITTTLLTLKPNVDRLVECDILRKLTDEIGNKFLEIQQSIENQEASRSKKMS